MKPSAIIVLAAIAAIVPPSGTTPAFATKMDGKCCTSSDGGRSWRYKTAMRRMAIPRTCSAYEASCIRDSGEHADRVQMCGAAKAQCMQSGVHVGPYSRRHFGGMQKI
jgi:hypothetical protein